ncbi:uncharacterized protein LOC111872294 [Cryptotermes secundus]|uniref:uncharacterized protein LOC111872294 n=1 Tax=Cryptotermes secundus TaxID=105785 RepID=UPI000CD7C9E4|nr:uncharacterized protein LOC111872294 [Cryptotermes secundus]
MVTKPVVLFLVALCLLQVLHGGLSVPGVFRRSVEVESTSQPVNTSILTNAQETTPKTLEDWKISFESLFEESRQLEGLMQSLNRSLQGLSSALDEIGNTLQNALQNSTRTSSSTTPLPT